MNDEKLEEKIMALIDSYGLTESYLLNSIDITKEIMSLITTHKESEPKVEAFPVGIRHLKAYGDFIVYHRADLHKDILLGNPIKYFKSEQEAIDFCHKHGLKIINETGED